MLDTLSAAKERIARAYPDAHFLTPEEVVAGNNVYWIERQQWSRLKIYVPTLATLVGLTPSGKARIMPYVCGKEITVVHLDRIFVTQGKWCSGEPLESHQVCSHSIEGVIYWNRQRYTKRYDKFLEVEEVERRVLHDWSHDPTLFTLSEPE